jgi:glycosyltransferase involved in cell wall biosynthesis
MGKNILFLVPYPFNESPSQRFRFEQYFNVLKERGYNVTVKSFLDSSHWQLFYSSGKIRRKAFIVMAGFLKRVAILFKLSNYHYIFIHREVAPVGPPLFEWIIAKIFRKKIIYDFDDAIWLTDRKHESFLFKAIKSRTKVSKICAWSYKISCGNHYLAEYAKQFNTAVVYNPTTIDTERKHNRELFTYKKEHGAVTIGWTGSHSTLKYLNNIENVLHQIKSEDRNVKFVIIADRAPELSFDFEFVKWNAETEIEDLLQFDIGIMPLTDDAWAAGKCGFKALQYMALCIPAVASPVGVNKKIISHGINGFLCADSEQWKKILQDLIHSKSLRNIVGARGRVEVIQNFSVSSNSPTFLSLFE